MERTGATGQVVTTRLSDNYIDRVGRVSLWVVDRLVRSARGRPIREEQSLRRDNRATVRSFRTNVSATQFLGNGILRGDHAPLCGFRVTVADCDLGATGKPDRPVPTATGQPLDPH